MNSTEFNLIDRIITCSSNKIHSCHRTRREIPLRKVFLATRTLDQARNEQNRLLMEEAESLRLIRNNQENNDWWFNTTNVTIPDSEEAPSSGTLFDANLLLDTGIIDFESSPLFTAPPASPSPLLDNLIDFNQDIVDFTHTTTDTDTVATTATTAITTTTTTTTTNINSSPSPLLDTLIDFNTNQEIMMTTTTTTTSIDFNGPTSSPASPTTDLLDIGDWSWLKEDKILEPISSNALLSHNNYDEEEDEEEESESEEDDFVVVLVNNIPPQDSKWISHIPKKRSLQLVDDDHNEPISNKRIRT